MADFVKSGVVGLAVGVAAVLLIQTIAVESGVQQELADGLNCPGPDGSTAAIAHHTAGYSLYSAS